MPSMDEALRTLVQDAVRTAVREVAGDIRRTTTGETQQLELLSVEDLAQKWGVKEPTVRGWIRSGRLRAVPDMRPYKVRVEEAARFISRSPGTSEAPEPRSEAARILARARGR